MCIFTHQCYTRPHAQLHVQMHPTVIGKVAPMTHEVRSSTSAALLSEAVWRKSARSGAVGNCVEIAPLGGGEIAMRNSRNPNGPALIYTRAEMAAFLAGAKDGEFDDVLH